MNKKVVLVLVLVGLVASTWYFYEDLWYQDWEDGSEQTQVQDEAVSGVDEYYDVVIVGAGAAGMTVAYELSEYPEIDYVVLEASHTHGGRMKKDADLADFPIDLGAEWIHEDPEILSEIVGYDVSDQTEVVVYNPKTYQYWNSEELIDISDELEGYSEHKFKDSTWFDFFDTYVVPDIQANTVYNSPVTSIDYSQNPIRVSVSGSGDKPSRVYAADQVVVAVPIRVLQKNYIDFVPALSDSKQGAIESVVVPDGLKVFLRFREKFYPDLLALDDPREWSEYHEKTFYDATFGKDTSDHVMGVLIVGESAQDYIDLDEAEIISTLLAELDVPYQGMASKLYIDGIVQNWSREPFISGTYTIGYEGNYIGVMKNLRSSVEERVFFTGAALDWDHPGEVGGVVRSAWDVSEEILDLY